MDGSFVYLDGSQMSYFDWKIDNPSDRDCIKLQRVNYKFKFASTDCDAKKFFMCQIRLQ